MTTLFWVLTIILILVDCMLWIDPKKNFITLTGVGVLLFLFQWFSIVDIALSNKERIAGFIPAFMLCCLCRVVWYYHLKSKRNNESE